MKIRFAFTALALLTMPSLVHAADYSIDPAHSSVGFKIRHLAISSVHGKFTTFTGDVKFDPAAIESSSAVVDINPASVDTEDRKRDDHLRNPDFFDIEKFPKMSFKTTKITKVSEGEFDAAGDLTIRGVTKPVTLRVAYLGSAKDPWGNERAGFSATTALNRKDFGLGWNKVLETGGLLVGDEVKVDLEVEAIKKK